MPPIFYVAKSLPIKTIKGFPLKFLFFVQIKFLFTSPMIDIVEKMIVYDVIDFFSDFGGFIGLFLGASCLTLIDFTVDHLKRVAEQKKNKAERKIIT
jgi:hypothetical protein